MDAYEALEARFVAWAETRPDIRLALVVGSRARPEPDPWGDLDVVILTTAPEAYAGRDWIGDLGEPWAAFQQPIRAEVVEWLIVYAGGLDFDLAVFPVSAPLTPAQVVEAHLEEVLARGWRILLDRDGGMGQLDFPVPQAQPPDAEAFQQAVHGFWRYVERAAKKLRRGELWMAKGLVDGTLKTGLLVMLEWHAGAGGAADAWYDGHHLEAWADPRALAALPETFARYETGDLWRALRATMTLYGWLGRETAARLGLVYPAETEAHIRAWVETLEEERGR
jgi:aminoglycoside 6-adenylyltransferase